MFEELAGDDSEKAERRKTTNRPNPTRASRASRSKKGPAKVAGKHQRRNKHWSW